MSEEKAYEVIDKRRVSTEAGAGAASSEDAETAVEEELEEEGAEAAETTGASPDTDAGSQATGRDAEPSGPPITSGDVALLCINQLHEIAWSRMGLVPNPMSGTIDKDLADARLAIDCVADLIARLEPSADPHLRRELQNLLANLRLNFVQQSQKG